MTVSIPESQGWPQYGVDTAPDFTGPLAATVTALAPHLGLVFADTADRDTVVTTPVAGMRAWLTDLQSWSQYEGVAGAGGGWHTTPRAGQRFVSAFRTVEDTAGGGTFGSVAEATWNDAPAGAYQVSCNITASGTVTTTGHIRLLANSANITADLRSDVSTTNTAVARSHSGPYTLATAGTLVVQALFQVGTGTLTLFPGGNVTATYLGPVV